MLSQLWRIPKILTRSEKIKFATLAFVLVFMGVFEVLGIASILPFIQLIADPEIVEGDGLAGQVYNYLNFDNHRQFVIFVGVISLGIIIFANLFKIFTEWLKLKLIWSLVNRISVGLLASYTQKNYLYFLSVNTKDLSTYIINESGTIARGVIGAAVELIGRLFVVLTILFFLIWVDVTIAMIMFGVLGGAYFLIYRLQRKQLNQLGSNRIEANRIRFRNLFELFDGIKAIKVYNSEAFFFKNFEDASKEYCSVQTRYHIRMKTPRFSLEMLAFGSMIGITIYLYLKLESIEEIIPTLTLYAVAGYKLLPALQSAFTFLGSLKHNWPSLIKIYPELITAKEVQPPNVHKPAIALGLNQQLTISKLVFSYPETEQLTLNDIQLEIKAGETIAFVGSTGSGKTTLIDIIVGLLSPQSGRISVDNQVLQVENLPDWRHILAYVPQDVFLFDDTVRQNVSLAPRGTQINQAELENACRLAGIHDFITSLPEAYQTQIGEKGVRLSGGQRQRLGLARALYRSPSLLVLDEATSALDNVTEQGIIEALASLPQEITIILIAHRLSTVQRADRIFLLDKGEIVASGTYRELLSSSSLFQQMVEAG
ncbi:MAG: ABC transporter ATP-binding protein [Bacteroidota bacterium]